MLPVTSFPTICRTCLIHSELYLIDDVNWEGLNLKEVIENWTPLQLKENDMLPKNMCKCCIQHMYTTYHFLFKCKKSENTLQEIIQQEIQNEPNKEILDIKASEMGIGENTYDKTGVLTSDNDIDDKYSVHNDNLSDFNDPEELKSDLCDVSEKNRNTIDSSGPTKTKKAIKHVDVENKVKLRKRAKAQLITYSNLVKSNKRSYVFRKGPPYTCITCDSSFQNYEELRIHKIETKHKKALKFICPYCQRKHDAYSKYLEHIRTHTGEKPNICSTCGKAFNFKTDLKRHMIMHMEVKPYNCRFCSKGFTRRQYLTDHERKHTGEQLICLFCGKGFHSYSTLSYHEKTHKGPPGCVKDPMSKDRLFQCHLCEKVLLTEHTLKSHILLHGPRNFSCDICGKLYVSKNRLQDHIRFSHQENKYSCNICNKEYKQKLGLEVHIQSHYGKNRYDCDTCGKQFSCKGTLYQHKRVHTGDTKYQCKECLHICVNKRHLDNHVRVHTGEKPFACVFCGKSFAQKANMQAHTKIHTGEKNHVCKVCGKAFYDGRGLRKHISVHDKDGKLENSV
ncbi:zinc finger protein OZF-like [Sitophilus oryzae]|uniref:Zinc finger protein OZF-like n=1 Tax=Sitophilus oryzae TaxID=7048 RepID=A0A6J2YBU4_SITOR|nr:zinc finger protein OZF-like [Sitophilus oryzae]